MNLSALRLVLLALPLAACSQTEQPIPEFETVTIDLREPGAPLVSRLAPVPMHKPVRAAAVPAEAQEATVASSRRMPWIPDFGRLTDCPNGVLCNAFTN